MNEKIIRERRYRASYEEHLLQSYFLKRNLKKDYISNKYKSLEQVI